MLIATSTPGNGSPTQTPFPSPAASIWASEMSVTGSASVIPYGVCRSAFGSTSATRCSRASETGAPAERTSRIRSRARRWSADSSAAVAATFRSAAGEAKTRVASIAAAASASAPAVSVPGFVTSMSGTEAPMPSAGPYSANGANAATNRSSGPIPQSARTSSSCARSWRCR